jgi:hypothetical protein
MPTDWYMCEYECGFIGTFEAVSEHEKECRHKQKAAVREVILREVDKRNGKGPPAQFDAKGDAKGFDAKGFDAKGFDAKGFDAKGFDAKGKGKGPPQQQYANQMPEAGKGKQRPREELPQGGKPQPPHVQAAGYPGPPGERPDRAQQNGRQSMYICDFKGCHYAGPFASVAKHEKICPFNPKRLAEHDGMPPDNQNRGPRMEEPMKGMPAMPGVQAMQAMQGMKGMPEMPGMPGMQGMQGMQQDIWMRPDMRGLDATVERRQDVERTEMRRMEPGRQAQMNGGQMDAGRKEKPLNTAPGAGRGAQGAPQDDGKEGAPYPEPFMAKAVYAFTPQIFSGSRDEEILFFAAGENVLVLDRDDQDNWWFGSVDDPRGKRQGWFPTDYVARA